MRVLWFCNTPGLAGEHLNMQGFGGGWISALQQRLEEVEQCELGYVFYTSQDLMPFVYGKTHYFPVKRSDDNKVKRYINRLLAKVEYDEHLQMFLHIINRFKPDIVHVHGTESSFGLIIPHLKKIPVVISIQGNLTVYTRKYFSGIERALIGSGIGNFISKSILNYRTFAKRASIELEILKNARFIIGRTDWDRRITRIMAPESKYFCVNEVIRSAFYYYKWQPLNNQIPVFFTTSSDNLYKGFETIVQAAALLSANNFEFRWLVAGLTVSDEVVRLSMQKERIKNLETIGIELLGKVGESTLINEMLRSNIFVQVSHIENSPNSLCEAMLLGMPVISTHAGGTASLVANNESGIVLQDGDAYALAGALLELWEDQEKVNYMAQNAYETAQERHDPEHIVSDLLQTYESVIREEIVLYAGSLANDPLEEDTISH